MDSGKYFLKCVALRLRLSPAAMMVNPLCTADVIFMYLIQKAEKAFDEELTIKHICVVFFSVSGSCEYRKLLHI